MSLIGKVAALFCSELDPTSAVHKVAAMVDPRLTGVPGYEAVLTPAVALAQDYYQGLAEALPGPVAVSVRAHADDSALRALFPSVADIQAALGRSLEVRDSIGRFSRSGRDEVCALLGMRRRPGNADRGEAGGGPLVDHTFRSLGGDEAQARAALRDAAFERLVRAYVGRLDELRRSWKLLHSEQQVHKGLARAGAQHLADDAPQHNGRLEKELSQAVDALAPEKVLHGLAAWLRAPESQLRLFAPTAEGDPALPTLCSNDRRRWLVCLARISVADALAALERESPAHRYILV